eukprot:Rhum_TRINITY_DN21392_c0_g1::Rhum_TRINITY_DN21392_c0_g1_i1::g.173935::m.173935/K01056/PTH1, pth, spoVC; peptidyl-tRNA hydrolase, PTH1 family
MAACLRASPGRLRYSYAFSSLAGGGGCGGGSSAGNALLQHRGAFLRRCRRAQGGAPVRWEAKLASFFERHCPHKAGNVDKLLEKYAGRESELWSAMLQKYGVTEGSWDTAAEGATAAAAAGEAQEEDAKPPQTSFRVILGLGNPGERYAKTKHNAGHIVLRDVVDHLRDVVPDCIVEENTKKGLAVRVSAEGWRRVALATLPGKDAAALTFWDSYIVFSNSYMNLSGAVASSWVSRCCGGRWGELLLVYDDMDLPHAAVKLRSLKATDSRAQAHNGLRDVAQAARNAPFSRLRIGVDRRNPLHVMDALDLSRLKDERPRVALACLLFSSSAKMDKILTAVNSS